MLALGIDPGTATVGWGLVREKEDGSLHPVAYGVIRTLASEPMPQRLLQIHDGLNELITRWQPQRAGVEELFFARNVSTAITVAQGRGVILLTLRRADVPLSEYKPDMVKQAIAGYGKAPKPQMQEMVRLLLGLEGIPRPDDAADALAVAITTIHSARHEQLVETRQ